MANYWPLPQRASAWLAQPRANRVRRAARLVKIAFPALLDRLTNPIADIALAVVQEVLRGR
jgi:hypothetical protein